MPTTPILSTSIIRLRKAGMALVLASGLASSQAQEATTEETTVVDGLMWALTASPASPWPAADNFCATLDVGGHVDWRLPTLAELQNLHDPNAENSTRLPLALDDCCAWGSESFADLEAERKGGLPDPSGPPAAYYWGFLFDGGIPYYSNGNFADGFAMCARDPG